MNSRLFILTNDPVPYGTANANYIRNFSKAIATRGWKVIVIGMHFDEKQKTIYQLEELESPKIQYWNLNISKQGGKNYLNAYFRMALKYHSVMKQMNINADDYILVYSTELSTALAAQDCIEVPLRHKAYIEVEWFQPYQYKYGILNPLYILWKLGFHYRANKFQKAIPISKNLEKFCIKYKCKTLVVPAMVDAKEGLLERSFSDKVDFIYPGSANDKDSFNCMIRALAALTNEEKNKVRFHLTGNMTYEKLLEIIGNADLLNTLESVLIFHGWMLYEELIRLYQNTDYLLLARAKNKVTISNFPSKVPEMMNYGIVPVCSKVGDYTEIYLKNGFNSIQFTEDNIEECVTAIRKAINIKENHQLNEIKKNARKTAEIDFDYRVWGKRIVEFLQS